MYVRGRLRPGQYYVSNGESRLQQSADYFDVSRHLDFCAFFRRSEQEDFTAINALFHQESFTLWALQEFVWAGVHGCTYKQGVTA